MKKRKYTILFLCIITACLALVACGKKKDKGTDEVTNTPTPSPTAAPTVTPIPTPEEQVPEETNLISEEDAIKNIQKIIGERGYTIELINDQLTVGKNKYYEFQVSDSSTVIEPNIIVDKVSGDLSCYYKDGTVSSFEEHPLFSQPTPEQEESSSSEFTKEDALAKLSKVPAQTLNLPESLSKYTIIYDDWTTFVNGVECYGINIFADVKDDEKINMGLYYVAIDGSVMFQFDSLRDDFVEIQ